MNAQQMLALQQIDSGLDRLAHRSRTLPERAVLDVARAALAAWHDRGAALAQQIAAREEQIARAESGAATLTAQRTRLEEQLKRIIAPREAEALMHEIDVLTARRGELDDAELEALSALGDLETDQLGHLAAEEPAHEAVREAERALAITQAEIAERAGALRADRAVLVPEIPTADLELYEAMRAHLDGVAVAQLAGRTCGGCHLDLSAVELEAVVHAPQGEMPECPQCGRLLAR